jgi:PAS domain S-box-containing protein
MKTARQPDNEERRLAVLRKYHILDTASEAVFDDIARMTAAICKTPIALITLVDKDRQWFKSKIGLAAPEIPRKIGFCAHAILNPTQIMVVEDTLLDDRFHDNPLVANDPNLRFYAGCPISTASGETLGTLCVIDQKPNSLSQQQREALRALANQVNAQLELRYQLLKTVENTDRQNLETKVRMTAGEAGLKDLADLKFALDQHAIVATTDVRGTITSVNDKFCAISKYSKEELLGQNHRILNSGKHSREFFQQLYNTIANGRVWHDEICNRAKDGSLYWVDTTIVPFLDADGKPRRYMAIRADITQRKQAEEALRISLATSEIAVKELADQKFALDQHAIVAVTNVQGMITYVNDKFCAISKYSKEELIGQNHRILNSGFHPREFFQRMYQNISNGQVWHDEICNRAKDGSLYWVDTTIVPFIGANGKPRQYVAIRADVTARRLGEQKLTAKLEELAHSNSELEQFAYMASHDLQEPLRMVASYTQLLSERYHGKLDATADKFIGYASEGALRMQVLIRDLLAFSRIGRSGVVGEKVDCNLVMDDVQQSLAAAIEESGAVIRCDVLPEVWADQSQIGQLFQNLIGNAIKFRGTTPLEIAIRVEKTGADWRFSVSDSGIGIAPEYAESIFIAFKRLHARTEYPGNGIGLAICKKIVEHYGGRIWVEGKVGVGSTFKFTLPAAIPTKTEIRQKLLEARN